jgi:hypothetical protein
MNKILKIKIKIVVVTEDELREGKRQLEREKKKTVFFKKKN